MEADAQIIVMEQICDRIGSMNVADRKIKTHRRCMELNISDSDDY